MEKLSVNRRAYKIVEQLLEDTQKYGITVERLPSGATIIDMGLQSSGGYLAGLKTTEICLGGLGDVSLDFKAYNNLNLPSVSVSTDHPVISLLGSQFAGWHIKVEDYFAIGSGPARALALKPKKLYKRIEYRDESDVAVLVLEAEKKPADSVAYLTSEKCNVNPRDLYMILVPTASVAGFIQIAGRIVETGLYRLMELGLNPIKVLYGVGYAPIMSFHPDPTKSMARANDSLFYGGTTHYIVDYEDDEKLGEIIEKAPSSTARDYGKPFYQAYKSAGFDFYKIDTALFAPATISVVNKRSGTTFEAGKVNSEMLKRSITS